MSRTLLSAGSQKSLQAVGAALAFTCALALSVAAPARTAIELALDTQDRAALEGLAAKATAEADARQQDAASQYRAALAQSALSQLALEIGDRGLGRSAAETGIRSAQRAVELKPGEAEYHRILGTLCGQVIPANVLAGLKRGQCALEEINKAVELAPKAANVWLSKGVGNYYLPAAFGGGVAKAISDLERSIKLDSKSPEAHLWLGIALRKAGRNPEARSALEKSLQLNPNRKWARQQLEKTPAR